MDNFSNMKIFIYLIIFICLNAHSEPEPEPEQSEPDVYEKLRNCVKNNHNEIQEYNYCLEKCSYFLNQENECYLCFRYKV